MTYQTCQSYQSYQPRNSPRVLQASCAATAALLFGVTLVGCGSSQPDPVAIPAAAPRQSVAPRTPPPPAVTPIAQLMAQLGIDHRISLPEDMAPMTDPERRAVLEFYDSFARGDSTVLASLLTKLDRDELDELVESGAWADATGKITRIDVQTGNSPHDGLACALAVFYVDGGFQPQMWYYTVNEDGTKFESVAAPPNLMDRLYGSDWIAAWFEILDEEMALADKPDEEFAVPQQVVGDDSDRGTSSYGGPAVNPSSPSQPSDPSRPTAPDGPGRRPKKGKRPAPGKG